jgi:hypothetical protein
MARLRPVTFLKPLDESGNILASNMIAIAIGVMFFAFGISAYFASWDANRTKDAMGVLDVVGARVQTYENDKNTYPAIGAWTDVVIAMPGYFVQTPCDPVDKTCTRISTSSDFTMQTDPSRSHAVIRDSAAHPARTVNGLPHFNNMNPFAAPVGSCTSTSCSLLVYSSIYGIEAW